ncbi:MULTISPECIES: hypothetical protein [Clostridium]|uniref:Uncharacterized protein n=1 Tax=Clostridium frigoriphilum TaxID=443253 RepID=A0ABU7UWU7_9CLOT|nr:hypothetical protein [Clostridium sp. DSM 17811]MBU3098713.1 hypothetical protein [Clostridium sp. DSM 17811]
MQHENIADLAEITQEQLDKIELDMSVGEIKTIYKDMNYRISLFKESPKKMHRSIERYGTIPFPELFKEMVRIVYPS